MLNHNKKKNAGIVYEQLVSLVTRLAANKKHTEAKAVVEIVKKHFKKGSLLNKEKKLFDCLTEQYGYDEKTAERILSETVEQAKLISENQLEKEKINLINDINKHVSAELYNIPLKNYKDLASIQILFNETRNGFKYSEPKERIKIQNNILKSLTKPKIIKEDVEIDSFTYKILVNKFNKKYNKIINEDQKEVLKGWLNYLVTSDTPSFQKLLENKIQKVKLALSQHMTSDKHEEEDYTPLLKEAYQETINFDFSTIDESVVYKVMRYLDVCEDLELV